MTDYLLMANRAGSERKISSYQKIVVVGVTGAGKSTLAKRLSEKLQLAHVELDVIHWKPNWVGRDKEDFRARTKEAIAGPKWVVAGNYGAVRDLVWAEAQAVVWLDYSFPRALSQLFFRTVSRVITREELFAGNKESFRLSFLSKHSIFLWFFKTYWKKKRDYPEILKNYPNLKVFRLSSPCELEVHL